MGLTIHFSGSFNPNASLASMIEEVEDVAKTYNWPYHIFETEFEIKDLNTDTFNDNIYGIGFTPPGCDTVFLCFLSNGKMSSPVHLQLYGSLTGEKDKEYLYYCFVKTQFAGYGIHMIIIHLLKHLERRYFKNFTVQDEGEYWATGDEERLKEIFIRYTFIIDSFAASLEANDRNEGESTEEYIKRIAMKIHDKMKEDRGI